MLSELPWDWSDVISASKGGQIQFDDQDLTIQKIDHETLKVAKVRLKIHRVVFQNASVEEIIEGYNALKSFCDVVRVIELLTECMIRRVKDQSDIPNLNLK